jgi:AcrR family transcriptional regulator
MAPPDDADSVAPERLRSDAERNRDRILDAARRLYSADGLGVSMAAVAREAGVGIATLFRRFPTQDELIAAVFADRMTAYGDAITAALADPDPWHGFAGYLESVCAMQAADRGFAEVLTMTFPTAKALEACRDQAYAQFVELIAKAKATGRLRQDFTPEDLPLLLMANAGVIAVTGDAAPDAWRRLVGLLVQAFAVPDPDPLPAAPSPAAMYRAMLTVHRTRNH